MLIHRGEESDEKQESLKISPHKLLINYKGKNSKYYFKNRKENGPNLNHRIDQEKVLFLILRSANLTGVRGR